MTQLADSIRDFGVREPGLARPRPEGGYELLCGNRRKRACEIVGLTAMPVIVRELDDDSAAIAMVDSNLQQREKLLYSEKAWAYKMRIDALKHRGIKADCNSADEIAAQTGDSRSKVFKLIRLTELVETLLDKVDARELAFNTAVELSHLDYDEQFTVVDAMAKHGANPSLSQAVRFKKMKQAGSLTADAIDGIMSEAKESPVSEAKITLHYRKYFPPDYSPKQVEAVIIELLRKWREAQTAEA
uniref:Chromosome (Plasmid) partitioning protein ParB / Stage 0 sporulation protein J n=1 Tax=uncultured bacterium contig00005 TaxID=1181497 RepID=A0A806KD46_9BACT|nr:chromosome (plasmid) partitioning protein ParB / Stage 0 sporulation protein J [uncultured bacterium contig00005]